MKQTNKGGKNKNLRSINLMVSPNRSGTKDKKGNIWSVSLFHEGIYEEVNRLVKLKSDGYRKTIKEDI